MSTAIDYEAELAVIIGTGGRGIPRATRMDHVWGYTIVNDVTARDLQGRHSQWLIGKSQDTFCPMGPWRGDRGRGGPRGGRGCAASSTGSGGRTRGCRS